MPTRIAIALCMAGLVLFAVGGPGLAGDLTVTGGDPVEYRCENGAKIIARYYALSDGSLRFVKVVMPDGKEYTLPNVVSGSGARYTDDMEILWWIKGDTAFVQARDQNGEWQTRYQECSVFRQEK